MIHTVIEEQLSEPKDYGKIKITATLSPLASEKSKKVQSVVKECLQMIREAVTDQPGLPLDGPKPDKPVKGQKKLPLNKDGLVETSQDGKTPAEFEVEEVEPGEIAAKGEAFAHPGKERPVARPAVPEPTGPLGAAVKA
jgi:hypothetical protein